MNIDEVITLDDNQEYVLLMKTNIDGNNYFLASKLINNKPSSEYEILKETIDNGEYYVEVVEDADLLAQILEVFEKELETIK